MQFVLTHLLSLMLIKMDASSIQTVNLFFPNDKNNARVVLDKENKKRFHKMRILYCMQIALQKNLTSNY